MKKICGVLLAAVTLFTLGVITVGKRAQKTLPVNTNLNQNYTVILDAGHGGEDGGAVAKDGTAEKDLNLMISNGIAAYFQLFGIPYIPVRTTDEAVCDSGISTVRERKRSDIVNRFTLVNSTPGSILLSIHQNMFSEDKYSGTQVFYSSNVPSSRILAQKIQDSVCDSLQPENTRKIKPSTDSIYLLYNAKTTSVLVECGFISNTKELSLLKSKNYQSQMEFYIFKGLLNYLQTEGEADGAKS